MGLLNGHNV